MNEQDIPIDIHISKLQEWLISRRLVPKTWHSTIPVIRDKINNAIKDMPAEENLIKLLSGAHINYFHCLEIVKILKQTEADTKNVFGMYSSQRMKDWQDVIRAYEKENIYLAEASQILVRNIQYELPSSKKQIAKLEQLSDEADKKIIDWNKSESVLRAEHAQLCQQLCIEGKQVRRELVKKLDELPIMYDKIAALFSTLDKSVNLYSDFSGQKQDMPLIRYISKHNNCTVYEFVYKEKPTSIEAPALKLVSDDDDNTGENVEIDFGDGGGDEINFDDITVEDEVDWGVQESAGEVVSLEESGISIEPDEASDGIAKGDEAYTILDSPQYRDRVIDELLELEAFLKMRLFELSTTNSSSTIAVSILERFSDHDAESITEMIQCVEIVLSHLTDQLVQHLNQIKHSPKYVDILTRKLHQKLAAVDKIKLSVEVFKDRSKEFLQQAVELKPQLEKIADQTKLLQKQIQDEISKRYKNRIVNLMGGVQ